MSITDLKYCNKSLYNIIEEVEYGSISRATLEDKLRAIAIEIDEFIEEEGGEHSQ